MKCQVDIIYKAYFCSTSVVMQETHDHCYLLIFLTFRKNRCTTWIPYLIKEPGMISSPEQLLLTMDEMSDNQLICLHVLNSQFFPKKFFWAISTYFKGCKYASVRCRCVDMIQQNIK